MSIKIDENGTITMYQGDTGHIFVSGLDTSENWTLYFAIQNSQRKTIGTEITTLSNGNSTVSIFLPSSLTDLLIVPFDQEYEIYFYGIKACKQEVENTLFIAGSDYGSLNKLIVYPKKVHGVS